MQKTWGHAKLNQGCSQQNSDCKKLYRMKDTVSLTKKRGQGEKDGREREIEGVPYRLKDLKEIAMCGLYMDTYLNKLF